MKIDNYVADKAGMNPMSFATKYSCESEFSTFVEIQLLQQAGCEHRWSIKTIYIPTKQSGVEVIEAMVAIT